jgi:hypothetical protein
MQLAVSGGQMTIPGAIFATVVLPVVTMTRKSEMRQTQNYSFKI